MDFRSIRPPPCITYLHCRLSPVLLFQAFSANIFMLIFARAYTGFSAASTPIAFTYITQMVPQENIMTEITNLVVILWLLSTVSPAFWRRDNSIIANYWSI
eukprot:UN02725